MNTFDRWMIHHPVLLFWVALLSSTVVVLGIAFLLVFFYLAKVAP